MPLRNKIKTLGLALVLLIGVPTSALASSGAQVVDGNWSPAGCLQIADVSAVVGLGTVPAGARLVLVRWRDDGTDPTAAIGMLIADGETLVYNGSLGGIEFIEVTAGAILNVCFYR
jgi:hypothetical protein